MEENHLARVCHVIKRDDFDGYGFNLHAEKGKPGQYIGKVDEDSPAELAGLKQGDRIIEVNGVNIGNETHKQVVQRIKAIADEVRLLVIDPNHVTVANNNQLMTNSAKNTITTTTSTTTTTATETATTTLNDQNNANVVDGQTISTSQESGATAAAAASAATSSITTTATATATTTTTTTNGNGQSPPSINKTDATAYNSAHITTSPTTTAAKGDNEGLNLKMTAAELRAKLAAKKKYDPKSDTVDLRKKYEIVQKL